MATTYQLRQNAYRQTQIHTASKEQLVLMLYDGVIRFSEQGRQAIENKDYEKKQFALVRSQDIIFELVNGLDHERGGEIASNLARLYAYAIKRLVDANMKNDTTGIDETQDIFRNLREAWAGAMAKVAKERADENPTPIEHTRAPAPTESRPREFAGAGDFAALSLSA
jgi:flagellar protein FliS